MQKNQIGQYIIENYLGRGSEASVYKGRHTINQQFEVAIKQYNSFSKSDLEIQKKLEYNLKLLGFLKQQQISGIVDCIMQTHFDEITVYLILEYARNGELFDYIANNLTFDRRVANFYCRQIIDSIQRLHQIKVAHRDIKPQNILLDDTFSLKLSDFGWSVYNPQNQHLDEKVGTADYMAPEMIAGLQCDHFKTDIFSLGVVLCLIVTSIHPFDSEPCNKSPLYELLNNDPDKFWQQLTEQCYRETKIQLELDSGFKELIQGMLAPYPEDRPSIEEVQLNPYFYSTPIASAEQACQYMGACLNLMKQEVEFPQLVKFGSGKPDKPEPMTIHQININQFMFSGKAQAVLLYVSQQLSTQDDYYIESANTSNHLHYIYYTGENDRNNCKLSLYLTQTKDNEIILTLCKEEGKSLILAKCLKHIRKLLYPEKKQ